MELQNKTIPNLIRQIKIDHQSFQSIFLKSQSESKYLFNAPIDLFKYFFLFDLKFIVQNKVFFNGFLTITLVKI